MLAQDSDIMSKKKPYDDKIYTEYDKDTFDEINEMLREFENEKINYQFKSSNEIELQAEETEIIENFQSKDMNTLVTKTLKLQSLPLPTPPKKPDDGTVNTQLLRQSIQTEISNDGTKLLLKKIRETDRIIQLKKYKKWKAIELRNKKIKIISIKLLFLATKISVKLIGRMLFFDFLEFANILDATSFLDNPTNGLLFLGFLEMTGSFTYFEIRNLRTLLQNVYTEFNDLNDEGKNVYRELFKKILEQLRNSKTTKLSTESFNVQALDNLINTIKQKIPYTSNLYGPDVVIEKILSLDIFANRSIDDTMFVFKELSEIAGLIKNQNNDKLDYIYQNLYQNIILDNSTQVITKVFTSSALTSLIGTSFWKIFSSDKSEYLIKVPGIRTTFFGVLTQEIELPFSFTDMIIGIGQTQITSFINAKIYINPDIKFPTPPPSDDDIWRRKLDSFNKKRKKGMKVEESYLLTLDELNLIEKDDTETFAKVYKLKKQNLYETHLLKNLSYIMTCAFAVKLASFMYDVITGPTTDFTNIEKAIYEPSFGFQWLYNLFVYQLGIGVFSIAETIGKLLFGYNFISVKIKSYLVKKLSEVLRTIYEDFKKLLSNLKTEFVTVKQKSDINQLKKRSLWNLVFSPAILLKIFDIVFFLIDQFIYIFIDMLYYLLPDITTENLNIYLEPEKIYMLFFKLTDYNYNIEEYLTNIFQYIASIILRSNQVNKDYLHGKLLSDERTNQERFLYNEEFLLTGRLFQYLPTETKRSIETTMETATSWFFTNFKLKKGAGQFLTPTKITGRIMMFDPVYGLILEDIDEDETSRDFTPPDINIILENIYTILKEIPEVYTSVKNLSPQEVKDEILHLGGLIPKADFKIVKKYLDDLRKRNVPTKLKELMSSDTWTETSSKLIKELESKVSKLPKSYEQTVLSQFLTTGDKFKVILNAFMTEPTSEMSSIFSSIIVDKTSQTSLLDKVSGPDAVVYFDVKYLGEFMYKALCENEIKNEEDFLNLVNSENADMLKTYKDLKKMIQQFKEVNPKVKISFRSDNDTDTCFTADTNKNIKHFKNLTQNFYNLFEEPNKCDKSNASLCIGTFYYNFIGTSLTRAQMEEIGMSGKTRMPKKNDLIIKESINGNLNLFSLFNMFKSNSQKRFRTLSLEEIYENDLHVSEAMFQGNSLYIPKRYPISDYFDERALADYLLEIIGMQMKITTGEDEDFLELKNLLDQLQSRIDYTDTKRLNDENIFSSIFFDSSDYKLITYTDFLNKLNDKSKFAELKSPLSGPLPDPDDDSYDKNLDELYRQAVAVDELKLLYYRHKANELGIPYNQEDPSKKLEKIWHAPLLPIKDFDSQFQQSSNIQELLGLNSYEVSKLWRDIPEKQFSFMETIAYYIRQFFKEDNSEKYIQQIRKINTELKKTIDKIDEIDDKISEQYKYIIAYLKYNLFTLDDNLQGPLQKMVTDFYHRLFLGDSIVSRKYVKRTFWNDGNVRDTSALRDNFKYFDFCQLLINIILQKKCGYKSECLSNNPAKATSGERDHVFLPIDINVLRESLKDAKISEPDKFLTEQFGKKILKDENPIGCEVEQERKQEDYNCITNPQIRKIIQKNRGNDINHSDDPSIMDIIKLMFYLEEISEEEDSWYKIKYLDLPEIGPVIKHLRGNLLSTGEILFQNTDNPIKEIDLQEEFRKMFTFRLDSEDVNDEYTNIIISQLKNLDQEQKLDETSIYEIIFIKGSIYQFLVNQNLLSEKIDSKWIEIFFSLDIQYFLDFMDKKCDKDNIFVSKLEQDSEADDSNGKDDEDSEEKEDTEAGDKSEDNEDIEEEDDEDIEEEEDNECILKTLLSKWIIEILKNDRERGIRMDDKDISIIIDMMFEDNGISLEKEQLDSIQALFKNPFLTFFKLTSKLRKESKLDIDKFIEQSILVPEHDALKDMASMIGFPQQINEVDSLYNNVCTDTIEELNKYIDFNNKDAWIVAGKDIEVNFETTISSIELLSKGSFFGLGTKSQNFEQAFKTFIQQFKSYISSAEGNLDIIENAEILKSIPEFDSPESFEESYDPETLFQKIEFQTISNSKEPILRPLNILGFPKATNDQIIKYWVTKALINYLTIYCDLKRFSEDKKKAHMIGKLNLKLQNMSNLLDQKKIFFDMFKEYNNDLTEFLKLLLNLETVHQLDFNIPQQSSSRRVSQSEQTQEQAQGQAQGKGQAQANRESRETNRESRETKTVEKDIITNLEGQAIQQLELMETKEALAVLEADAVAESQEDMLKEQESLNLLEMLSEVFSFLSDGSNANRRLLGDRSLSQNPFSLGNFQSGDVNTETTGFEETSFSEQCIKHHLTSAWRPHGFEKSIQKNPSSPDDISEMNQCVLGNILVMSMEKYIAFYSTFIDNLKRGTIAALATIKTAVQLAKDSSAAASSATFGITGGAAALFAIIEKLIETIETILKCLGPSLTEKMVRVSYLMSMQDKIKEFKDQGKTHHAKLLATIISANKNFYNNINLGWSYTLPSWDKIKGTPGTPGIPGPSTRTTNYGTAPTEGTKDSWKINKMSIFKTVVCNYLNIRIQMKAEGKIQPIVTEAYDQETDMDNFFSNDNGKKSNSVLLNNYNVELNSDIGYLYKNLGDSFLFTNTISELFKISSSTNIDYTDLGGRLLRSIISSIIPVGPAYNFIRRKIFDGDNQLTRLEKECDKEMRDFRDTPRTNLQKCIDLEIFKASQSSGDIHQVSQENDDILSSQFKSLIKVFIPGNSGKHLLFGTQRDNQSFQTKNKAFEQIESMKKKIPESVKENFIKEIQQDTEIEGCEDVKDFEDEENKFCQNLLNEKIEKYIDNQVTEVITPLFDGLNIAKVFNLLLEIINDTSKYWTGTNDIKEGPWFDFIVGHNLEFNDKDTLYKYGFFEYFMKLMTTKRDVVFKDLPVDKSDESTKDLEVLLTCLEDPCSDDDNKKRRQILEIALLSKRKFFEKYDELTDIEERKLYLRVFFGKKLSTNEIDRLSEPNSSYSFNDIELWNSLDKQTVVDDIRQKKIFTFILYNLIENFYTKEQQESLDLYNDDKSIQIKNIEDLYDKFLKDDNQLDIVDCMIHRNLDFPNSCKAFFKKQRIVHIIPIELTHTRGLSRDLMSSQSTSHTLVTEELKVTTAMSKLSELVTELPEKIKVEIRVLNTEHSKSEKVGTDGKKLPDFVILDNEKVKKEDLDTFYTELRDLLLSLFLIEKKCEKKKKKELLTEEDIQSLKQNDKIVCSDQKYTMKSLRNKYKKCITKLYDNTIKYERNSDELCIFLHKKLKGNNPIYSLEVDFDKLQKFSWIYGKLVSFEIQWSDIQSNPANLKIAHELGLTESDFQDWKKRKRKSWLELTVDERNKAEILGFTSFIWNGQVDVTTILKLTEKMFGETTFKNIDTHDWIVDEEAPNIAYFNYYKVKENNINQDTNNIYKYFQSVKESLAAKIIQCGKFVTWNTEQESYNLENMFESKIEKQEITLEDSVLFFKTEDYTKPIDRVILFSDAFLNQWWLTNSELKLPGIGKTLSRQEQDGEIFDEVQITNIRYSNLARRGILNTDGRIKLTSIVTPAARPQQVKFLTFREPDFQFSDNSSFIEICRNFFSFSKASIFSTEKSTLAECLKLIIENYSDIEKCATHYQSCKDNYNQPDTIKLLKIYEALHEFLMVRTWDLEKWAVPTFFLSKVKKLSKELKTTVKGTHEANKVMREFIEYSHNPAYINIFWSDANNSEFLNILKKKYNVKTIIKRGSKRTQHSSFIFPDWIRKGYPEDKPTNARIIHRDRSGVVTLNPDYERVFNIPLPQVLDLSICGDIGLDTSINNEYKFKDFYDEVQDESGNKFLVLKTDIPTFQAYRWIQKKSDGRYRWTQKNADGSFKLEGIPANLHDNDPGRCPSIKQKKIDGEQDIVNPNPEECNYKDTNTELFEKELELSKSGREPDLSFLNSGNRLSIPDFLDFGILEHIIASSINGIQHDVFIDSED